jgi:hypothetical protein
MLLSMYASLHKKYRLFLVDIYETDFLDIFSKNFQISYLTQMHPVWSELFHGNEQTRRGK